MSHVKRMFSMDEATAAILNIADCPASEYVRQSILNNCLPVYAKELRVVALRLLDCAVGSQKYIGKLQGCDIRDEAKWAVKNTLEWISTHHIESITAVEQLLTHFPTVKLDVACWNRNQSDACLALADAVCKGKVNAGFCKSDLLYIIRLIGTIEAEYITSVFKGESEKRDS